MRIKQINGYEFKSIAFFLTVAREQSFTKAARQLNITQPTLSRQRGGRGKEPYGSFCAVGIAVHNSCRFPHTTHNI